jgi:hypothetical protein
MDEDEGNIGEGLGPDWEGVEEGVAVPIMRAVYARRRLTVVVPHQRLTSDGDISGMGFGDRSDAGISIMELGETELDGFGWELTVGFLADGDRTGAERALETWSSRVGYRRVWFPERIYEPGNAPNVCSRAGIDCPTCGHAWRGTGRRFWAQIWEVRLFPNLCPLCGCNLPQWRVQRRAAAATLDGTTLADELEEAQDRLGPIGRPIPRARRRPPRGPKRS